jgi:hypothetical protein
MIIDAGLKGVLCRSELSNGDLIFMLGPLIGSEGRECTSMASLFRRVKEEVEAAGGPPSVVGSGSDESDDGEESEQPMLFGAKESVEEAEREDKRESDRDTTHGESSERMHMGTKSDENGGEGVHTSADETPEDSNGPLDTSALDALNLDGLLLRLERHSLAESRDDDGACTYEGESQG